MFSEREFQYCLITDRKRYRQALHEVAELAEEAGVDYFQLREKDLSPSELLIVACHLRAFLVRTKFIVNGHLDVALASGADGVHLQKENVPVSAVRRKYPGLIIGYSAHSYEEVRMAEQAGAGYVFVSPVFEPQSKISVLAPLGLETLRSWIEGTKIPVFGLGGVTVDHLNEIKVAGCAGAAGISFFLREGRFDSQGMVIR